MRNERADEVSNGLAEECVAVLEGRYCEALAAEGRPRPGWAWLNLPAHGLDADLRARCRAANEAPPPEGSWQEARSEVCRIATAVAPEWGGLLTLQREVLVPLELDLMTGQVQVRTPASLVAKVLLRVEATGTSPSVHEGT
jgi:hypothetical protein